ncbi:MULTISPECIES: amino acid adenylation domain-containing protein, partial [unclassified Pseudomonas]|uniref:non-ribosomal peptide synthetase n=1 Tax=unclassified Pseudomonas TaxID=196821 RepID=UPI00244CDE89
MDQLHPVLEDDLLSLLLADDTDTEHPVRPRHEKDAPLSFAQQRLWLLQQLAPESSAYNLPRGMVLTGLMDHESFEKSLQAVIDRHEILKSRFLEKEGVPYQSVDAGSKLSLPLEDLSLQERSASQALIEQYLQHEANTPFDLSESPAVRARLFRLSAQEHVLILNMHHIVSDAWSNPILLQDLARAYRQIRQGGATELEAPTIQYGDYAHWQRHEYPATPQYADAETYWKHYLGQLPPPLLLPTDFPRADEQANTAAAHTFALPAHLHDKLEGLCQRTGLLPFVVFLGAWQVLLGRYGTQNDFTIGVPNATRNQEQTQELVGLFASSQVYRAHLEPAEPTKDFLHRLRLQSIAALEHSQYPYELLAEQLLPQQGGLNHQLFQTLFNWRVESTEQTPLHLDDLHLELMSAQSREAKFELSLDVAYSRQTIHASIEYNSELFTAGTIEHLAGHWLNLLDAMAEDPSRPLGELPLLSEPELSCITRDWNATRVDYPLECHVHRLVEEQAGRTPDAAALHCGELTLSYSQLNDHANRLAHRLIELGVGPESLVGIAMERSVELVVGMLAVLKAGGAYVPLDPAYPEERLAYMLQDSGVSLLLSQSHLSERLSSSGSIHTLILGQDDSWLQAYESTNPQRSLHGDNPAYLIYTSGSTGLPKGVLVRHRALSNHMFWMQDRLCLGPDDRVLQKTAFSFDASVWEFWLPLINGAQLVLAAPELSQKLHRLWDEVARQRISILQLAPSLLQALMHGARASQLASLRAVLLGGEAFPEKLARQLRQLWPGALYNLYGPTEATIDSSCHELNETAEAHTVAIGTPIANVGIHILSGALQPCAAGMTGELYIGGT